MLSRHLLTACALVLGSACSIDTEGTMTGGGPSQEAPSPVDPKPDAAVVPPAPPVDAGRPAEPEKDAAISLPDAEICENVIVEAQPKLPKILIVLDRSQSMVRESTGPLGTPVQTHRWEKAVPALKRVTAELEDVIQFGLMYFPGTPPKPYGKDFCESGHINVELGLNSAGAIATTLDATEPKGATPLAKTLDAAREALTKDRDIPDTVPRDGYVLLITDGQPVCLNDSNINADPENSYAAMDRLREADIKTYVIGFDTGGIDVLDNLASRGGTGETKHRLVTDEEQLVKDLEEISRSLVSCKYALDKAPADPNYVRVQIDGKSYPFSDQGWQLVDEKTIELRGPACMLLQDSKDHVVEITVECKPVIVVVD
jgi:hypothetical protein